MKTIKILFPFALAALSVCVLMMPFYLKSEGIAVTYEGAIICLFAAALGLFASAMFIQFNTPSK